MKETDHGPRVPAAVPPAAAPVAERPVLRARSALAAEGVHLMPAALTSSCTGLTQDAWIRFGAHWDALAPDRYASARGVCRERRYGCFSLTAATGRVEPLPHHPFVQPERSNPMYVGVDRVFEPLTPAFAADPVLREVLRLLGRAAAALDDPAVWHAQVHPFRVTASADARGLPTPEGRHRDGVTLVSSLAVGRRNAAGGESTVYDPAGRRLLAVTLSEPGTLLLADDRRTLHAVSPVHPVDGRRPAHRDVLVVTLAPG